MTVRTVRIGATLLIRPLLVDSLHGLYRPIRRLLLSVLGRPTRRMFTQQRSLTACISAAFIVTIRYLRPTSPLRS